MKYKEWLNLWLENYVKPAAKPKTYTRYNEIVHRHLIDELGETEVKKITPLLFYCSKHTFYTKHKSGFPAC